MSSKHEPDWEVVDEIPGEKKPQPKARGTITSFFKSKKLWFGLIAGAALVILVPVFRIMLQNAVRAWWIWLGLGLYWVWSRTKKSRAR